ncbi:MAG: bifunctional demethylmenaquinone methyltransferase/2-methoxy-6-polyprenyl-1,4-benzoquinol methylase UbiE [Thermoguttaceae bacterium]
MNHLPSTQIRQMFGEIAGWYDFLNHLLSLGVDRLWRGKTVRLVAPQDGAGPILDVCTGTADLALAYWRASRRLSAVRVVGADFCRPMLEIGNKKSRRAGAGDRLILIEADTVSLPFPDEVFQIVSVAFGLRNVSDPDKGLQEMVRVCRRGGSVAVLEFSMPRIWPFNVLYNWYFHRVLPRIGQTLARNTQKAYNYLPESVDRFPQREAFVQRLREAGLKEAAMYPFTFGIATLYVGTKG